MDLFIEERGVTKKNQAILEALEAILGQRSAHSLATGPVIALPVTQTFEKS